MQVTLLTQTETNYRAKFVLDGKHIVMDFNDDTQVANVVDISDEGEPGQEITETSEIYFKIAVNHKIIDWLIYKGFMAPTTTKDKSIAISISRKEITFEAVDAIAGDKNLGNKVVIAFVREFKRTKPLLLPNGLPKTGAVEQDGDIFYPKDGFTVLNVDGKYIYASEGVETVDGYYVTSDKRLNEYVDTPDGLVKKNLTIDVMTESGIQKMPISKCGMFVKTTTGMFIKDSTTATKLGYEKNEEGKWFIVRDELNVRIVPWKAGRQDIGEYHKGGRFDMSLGEQFVVGLEIEKIDEYIKSQLNRTALEKNYGWTVERDGSLPTDGGFELISPKLPLMRTDIIRNHLESLRPIIDADYNSRCGGHIHLSSRTHNPTQLFDMVSGFFPLLYAIYPDRVYREHSQVFKIDEMKKSRGHRQAINLSGYNTIEFRIFPAVTSVESLYRRLELIRVMINNANTTHQDVCDMLADKTDLYTLLRGHFSRIDYNNIVDRLQYFTEAFEQKRISPNFEKLETV